MRSHVFVIAAASALALSAPALSQPAPPRQPPMANQESVPGSTRCLELRGACQNNPGPGARGLGNCNWYRDNCR